MIELDLDVTIVERTVYNMLMLLGDVGGFTGIIWYASASLISIVTFQSAQNHIAQNLYQSKQSSYPDD